MGGMMRVKGVTFADLIGKVITAIQGATVGSDVIAFDTADDMVYRLYHDQECCESVEVNDICGDINDLLNSPVISAEESTDTGNGGPCDSFTWTFYRISTGNGTVVIKWYGSSNGYYSESVDFDGYKVVTATIN